MNLPNARKLEMLQYKVEAVSERHFRDTIFWSPLRDLAKTLRSASNQVLEEEEKLHRIALLKEGNSRETIIYDTLRHNNMYEEIRARYGTDPKA